MFFNTSEKPRICQKCGYKAYPPYPVKCPKCQTDMIQSLKTLNESSDENPIDSKNLSNNKNYFSNALTKTKVGNKNKNIQLFPKKMDEFIPKESNKSQTQNFAQNILLKARPDMVISGGGAYEVPILKKNSPENGKKRRNTPSLKIKEQETPKRLDFNSDLIDLGVQGEYFRYFGITDQDHNIIFSSNEHFNYLLDLASNLEYISTSILTGKLDRMILTSLDEKKEEVCYFHTHNQLIYVIYGNIPDKKASWLMRQMYITFEELHLGKNPSEYTKIEHYNLTSKIEKRLKYYLQEYIKLQSVFSSNKLKSVDKFLRVDYFGLSYQSIGILSKLITGKLEFQKLPNLPVDLENREEIIQELKEGQITAKLEAMAANCVANTEMIPKWISVKLGFQRYRFIIFAKINDYYLSLLVEGNLEYRQKLLNSIKQKLNILTSKAFVGELKEYYDLLPEIISTIDIQNQYQPQ